MFIVCVKSGKSLKWVETPYKRAVVNPHTTAVEDVYCVCEPLKMGGDTLQTCCNKSVPLQWAKMYILCVKSLNWAETPYTRVVINL